jgi:hypothetical protein
MAGQADKIIGSRLGKTQRLNGVMVDGGMTKIAEKTATHDLAEPKHGTLVCIIHDLQRALKPSVDLGGRLIGNIGNIRHGCPPDKWVLGGRKNIRKKGENSKG